MPDGGYKYEGPLRARPDRKKVPGLVPWARNTVAAAAALAVTWWGGNVTGVIPKIGDSIRQTASGVTAELSKAKDEAYGSYIHLDSSTNEYVVGQQKPVGIGFIPDKNGHITLLDSAADNARPQQVTVAQLRHVMVGRPVFGSPFSPIHSQIDVRFNPDPQERPKHGNLLVELEDFDGNPAHFESGKKLLPPELRYYINVDQVQYYPDLEKMKSLNNFITQKEIDKGLTLAKFAKNQGLEAVIGVPQRAPGKNYGYKQVYELKAYKIPWSGKINGKDFSENSNVNWPLLWDLEVRFYKGDQLVSSYAPQYAPQSNSWGPFFQIQDGGRRLIG